VNDTRTGIDLAHTLESGKYQYKRGNRQCEVNL
jgi:hypothetical protein